MRLDITKTGGPDEFILACDLASFSVVVAALREVAAALDPARAPTGRERLRIAELHMATAICDEWLATNRRGRAA